MAFNDIVLDLLCECDVFLQCPRSFPRVVLGSQVRDLNRWICLQNEFSNFYRFLKTQHSCGSLSHSPSLIRPERVRLAEGLCLESLVFGGLEGLSSVPPFGIDSGRWRSRSSLEQDQDEVLIGLLGLISPRCVRSYINIHRGCSSHGFADPFTSRAIFKMVICHRFQGQPSFIIEDRRAVITPASCLPCVGCIAVLP